MLIMIPFMLDEVIAIFQFLRWSRRRGKPLIRTFFKGGAIDAGSEYQVDTLAEPRMLFADATRGITVPWTLLACVGIGIFLMLTRLLIGTSGSIANTHHVNGALVITVAVISMAEVARALRLLILPLGAWLIAFPWTSQAASPLDLGVSALLGLALSLLSLPFGRRSNEHYDSWDAYIR